MDLSNKQLDKYFGHLEEHEYRHYNNALGCMVEGKEHFKYLMRKGNFLPYEYAEETIKEDLRKEHKLGDKALDFIKYLRLKPKDKRGNTQFYPKEIDKMKELGVRFDFVEQELDYRQGGFGAT
jgi:hypothetical protein